MNFYFLIIVQWGFPGGTVGKNLPTSAGDARDMGLIPGWERSPGEGNGNPLQDSCLENTMDRGTCWATVHEVTKESDTTEQRNNKDHVAWRTCGSSENLRNNNDKKNTSYK